MEEKNMMLANTKDDLLEAFKAKVSEGIANMDAEEAGEVTDMIKDLAEAEKLCWEAKYFEEIVSAMHGNEREGYDPYRYANGRYAPTGRGTRRGYEPDFYNEISDKMVGYTPDYMDADRAGFEPSDPMDMFVMAWHKADKATKRKMRGTLEEMSKTLGE